MFRRNIGSTQDIHGATSQKTAFFIVVTVKTSNLTLLIMLKKQEGGQLGLKYIR
jgi:hypothetical protein